MCFQEWSDWTLSRTTTKTLDKSVTAVIYSHDPSSTLGQHLCHASLEGHPIGRRQVMP